MQIWNVGCFTLDHALYSGSSKIKMSFVVNVQCSVVVLFNFTFSKFALIEHKMYKQYETM